MDQQSKNRTKSWLYRLRYLKLFKSNSNPNNESIQTAPDYSDYQTETADIASFRRSSIPNSLFEQHEPCPHIRKNDNNLRRSLRKWHSRMKNCFSKNSRHLTQRQTIHIVHAPASPSLSHRSFSATSQKENIYTLDPFILQRKCRSPGSDQVHSNNSSLTPSPSRLTAGSESQPRSPTLSELTESGFTPKNEVSCLAHCVWYWGPASKAQVDAKLDGAPDGSFLVRDSASDRHIFSISFRSVGKTLHARIEYTSSGYKIFDHEGYATVKELIEKAIEESEKGLLCYTKSRSEEPNYPVRLLKPISRYDEVRSLQSLSRFIIRQNVNYNDIDKLCLPLTLISYLKEENYFR